jgi:hypothetical protein
MLNYLILCTVALSVIELFVSSNIMHNLATPGETSTASPNYVIELIVARLVCIFGAYMTRSSMLAWTGKSGMEYLGSILRTLTMFLSLMSFGIQIQNYEYMSTLEVKITPTAIT